MKKQQLKTKKKYKKHTPITQLGGKRAILNNTLHPNLYIDFKYKTLQDAVIPVYKSQYKAKDNQTKYLASLSKKPYYALFNLLESTYDYFDIPRFNFFYYDTENDKSTDFFIDQLSKVHWETKEYENIRLGSGSYYSLMHSISSDSGDIETYRKLKENKKDGIIILGFERQLQAMNHNVYRPYRVIESDKKYHILITNYNTNKLMSVINLGVVILINGEKLPDHTNQYFQYFLNEIHKSHPTLFKSSKSSISHRFYSSKKKQSYQFLDGSKHKHYHYKKHLKTAELYNNHGASIPPYIPETYFHHSNNNEPNNNQSLHNNNNNNNNPLPLHVPLHGLLHGNNGYQSDV